MILVSSHISKEEFPCFEDDIAAVFPKFVITTIETPDVKFKVVSIHEYPMITNNSIPILTPISIHQMRDYQINTYDFTLPLYGFINLHLFQRKVVFSGFGSSKQKLKDMSLRMGAIVEQGITPKTSLLVSKTLKSDLAQAAIKFKIPIVQDKFIYDLFMSKEIFNENDYELKLYSGLFFTTACCNKNEKEEIKKYVIENGGTFLDGLYKYHTNSVVISKASRSSKKFKKAIDMNQKIISDNFKEIYSTPQSLRNDTLPPLIPSDLFNNMTFYISPKLEKISPNAFYELKLLLRQHGGQIINVLESANYIIQMDTEKDNYIDKHSQNGRSSQNHSYKRKSSFENINANNNSDCNGSNPKLCLRTPIWVERSIEEGQLLPVSDFRLFSPTQRSKRNGNFHVSLTGFSGNEYLNLNSTLRWLDIQCSTRFKKSMTHLIAKDNWNSKKTQAAKEWDIPIVGVDWIFNIAEGNLTSEALSNPWSPKRSQKVERVVTEPKNNFNLDNSDDDIIILEKNSKVNNVEANNFSQQKQLIISQNNLNNKLSNSKVKINSPVIHSGSSSQRIPLSPKKIQTNTTDSKVITTTSQPKHFISFLDDDDDDDLGVDFYEEIESRKMTQKDIQDLNSKNVLIINDNKKNIQQDNNFAKLDVNTAFNPIQNLSQKKTQLQSPISPKHSQVNQVKKNDFSFLSSSSSSDDDYLSILQQPSVATTVSAGINQKPSLSKNSTMKISANSQINNNINQKITINQASNSHIQNIGNNTNYANMNNLSHNNIQKNNINRSLSSNASFQSNLNNSKPEVMTNHLQTSRPPQFSSQKEIIKKVTSNADIPMTPKNSIFDKDTLKADKTITPPTAYQNQDQNHSNQNLFEIKMRQPSPPPPPSVYQSNPIVNRKLNNNTSILINNSMQNSTPQKSVTIIADQSYNSYQQQAKRLQPIRNFLDDDDDDDFAEVENIENVKIADATQRILKVVNRKRKMKKNNGIKNNSKIIGGDFLKDRFGSDNSDSQFDTLETFTQRPNDTKNDDMRIVSYDETDEPKKKTMSIDDEDPFLSLLQK